MTNTQKITIWTTALDAMPAATFAQRLLVSHDVAKALSCSSFFENGKFELTAKRRVNGS